MDRQRKRERELIHGAEHNWCGGNVCARVKYILGRYYNDGKMYLWPVTDYDDDD